MIRKKCEYCGRILWMRSSTQEMCYRCFTEKQKQLGNTTGTCAICGKEFVKTRSNQKYCGPDCQKAAKRIRHQNYCRKKEVKSRNTQVKAEWKRQEKARAKMREIRAKSHLDQNIEAARTQGISYGELQARRYLASMPPIDTRIGGDR